MPAAAALEPVAAAPPALRDISVVGVRKTFGVTRALDGCSFFAARGEIHAIVGGNGCGKSTLAKVISGVLPPDAGQVSVFGHTPTSPHEAYAVGIATVFQEVLVADEGSVVENLFLGADPLFSKSLPARAKLAAAGALMRELSGSDVDPRALAGTLPLGLKQWITIGRALLARPKALVLDESSAALDLDATERLFAKLRELRDEGTAIIIVTHRIAELIAIADRATVLRDGRDVGVLERKEITERNLMRMVTGREAPPAAGRVGARAVQGGEVVLETRELRVRPTSPAIALHLRRGEILGVAGLDGQGQSEFVRILAGVETAGHGAPRAFDAKQGRFVDVQSLRDAADCAIAYVSGDRKREGIFPNLDIFENLLVPRLRRSARAGKLAILDRPALTSVFDFEADRLAVKMGDRHDRITSLSGGNQQKVLIGRAFALNPTILVLDDPARGVDVGAKADLYRYLKDFAATGKSVIYLTSEIEELTGFADRVLVFRHGGVFESFEGDAIEPAALLQAMFGQGRGPASARLPGPERDALETPLGPASLPTLPTLPSRRDDAAHAEAPAVARFALRSSAFDDGSRIPERYAEQNKVSPPLQWSDPPAGTKSFALAITDPDIPAQFNFPRAFAHWLVYDIPASARALDEDASGEGRLPGAARELNSDFVTFGIAGFQRGYGGPWPPDAAHRYVFTLYALKSERLDLPADADYPAFVAAVLPTTITTATTMGVYGPARRPLPSQ